MMGHLLTARRAEVMVEEEAANTTRWDDAVNAAFCEISWSSLPGLAHAGRRDGHRRILSRLARAIGKGDGTISRRPWYAPRVTSRTRSIRRGSGASGTRKAPYADASFPRVYRTASCTTSRSLAGLAELSGLAPALALGRDRSGPTRETGRELCALRRDETPFSRLCSTPRVARRALSPERETRRRSAAPDAVH